MAVIEYYSEAWPIVAISVTGPMDPGLEDIQLFCDYMAKPLRRREKYGTIIDLKGLKGLKKRHIYYYRRKVIENAHLYRWYNRLCVIVALPWFQKFYLEFIEWLNKTWCGKEWLTPTYYASDYTEAYKIAEEKAKEFGYEISTINGKFQRKRVCV